MIYCIYIDYQNEIRIMLIIEMAKTESTGGHNEIRLVIEITKIEINWRPYWQYANYRDGQNRLNRRPYWHYANYRDGQNKINPTPYWHYANDRDGQNRINRRPYWI